MSKLMSPALEDYLESILIIEKEKEHVRVKDVAKFIDVKPPSVIEALKHLEEKKLVVHEHYGYIKLTNEGLSQAEDIYERHNTLNKFLNQILGVEEKIAEKDACKIEHYLSKETLEKIIDFVKFIETYPVEGKKPDWLEKFYYFSKHQKRPGSCPTK